MTTPSTPGDTNQTTDARAQYDGAQAQYDGAQAQYDDAPLADRELLEMLRDAEAKVEQLRAELNRRREQRRAMHEGQEDDAEVERLSAYLEQAQINWQAVRDFFQSAIDEYRGDKAWGTGRTRD